MRITGVHLKNIACFEDLSLDFTHENTGEAAPWVVILGENGTGKSTLLQVMSAGFLGARLSRVAASDVDFIHYVRDVELGKRQWAEGYVRMEIGCDEKDLGESTFPNDAVTEWPFSLHGTINLDRKANLNIHVVAGDYTVHRLHGDDLDGGWFACGYGSARRLTGQPTTDRGSLPTVVDSAKPYRFASMFGTAAGMTNVPDWIAGLYFSAIYPEHNRKDEMRYEMPRDALLVALPSVTRMEVTKDRRVMVTEGDTTVPLERLSDGYRGTLAWVGDLIRRLFDAYPDSDDPLKESGVVLVDEIDLHLHPKWQRSVVEDVRKLFPNLQFIVTSHSPFVAQDMRPEDKIIVLERSGKDGKGPVVAREENGSLEDWSADQILSDFFGLRDGTRGTKTQKAETRFVRLLGAEAQGTLTTKQAKELEQLRGKIDAIPLGETPDERAFYRMADDMVALMERRLREHEARTNGVHEEAGEYGDAADSTSED